MHGLILAELGSDWTLAGSVETFALPVGLFLVVAAILFFLYTRPHVAPGHRDLVPAGPGARATARAGGSQAATGTSGAQAAGTSGSQAAGTSGSQAAAGAGTQPPAAPEGGDGAAPEAEDGS